MTKRCAQSSSAQLRPELRLKLENPRQLHRPLRIDIISAKHAEQNQRTIGKRPFGDFPSPLPLFSSKERFLPPPASQLRFRAPLQALHKPSPSSAPPQLPRIETKSSPANSFTNSHSRSNVLLPPAHDAPPARRSPRPRRKASRRHGHHELHPRQGDSPRPAL